MKNFYDTYNSPIGLIHVVVDEIGVKKIFLFEEEWNDYLKENTNIKLDKDICRDVIVQLNEYFNKKRKNFNLSLSIEGTEFRKKVWKALMEIPYGEVRTYTQIANEIGNPKAVRAVGQANRANELPIIIPCHRVIGKDGKLVGYAGDKIFVKRFLLELEEGID
ncbi:MAG: methylated-DNA--[protein]-cysteine S-methyltransferase [Tissierellia bacterium]|nr:methylated-DNA--[protein]-cysteine S-methyltransferase [Tissierellia bacterium]